jgi:hypothetical protein
MKELKNLALLNGKIQHVQEIIPDQPRDAKAPEPQQKALTGKSRAQKEP